MLGATPRSFLGDLRLGATARVPEGEDLEPLTRGRDAVVDVEVDSAEMHPANTSESDISSTSTNARLKCDKR
jgi:hypothetical protein